MVYAGFWRRFAAVILDTLVLLLPMIAINWAVPYVGAFILAAFYYPIFESSSMQATPGKYWMGMKVLHENGQTLSFARALARLVLRQVSSFVLLIGYIMQVFTAKRQAFHDLVTNAVVINHTFTTSPDWFDVWLKQVRYALRLDEAPPASAPSAYAATGVTAAPNHSSSEAVESIEKLYELYKNGVLTEEEFQNKKSELLKQV